MAKTKISEFSATPGNNTDIDGINIAEGCAPSGINDAIRELMAQLKDWQAGTSNDPYVVGSSGSLTLSYGTANGVPYLNGSKVVTSGSALTFDGTNFATTGSVTSAGSSNSGNLTFTGTGNRITGDFSNATLANRVAFQTSTTNGPTQITAMPNGTSTQSQFTAVSGTDLNNANGVQIRATSTEAAVMAYNTGSASALPMTFYTGGSERMRVDTSGNVGIGTSSPTTRLSVVTASTNAGISVNDGTVNTIIYNSTGGVSSIGTTTNHPVDFYANNAARMRIDTSGNVGIGTSSPEVKLDVAGDILINNNSYLYGENSVGGNSKLIGRASDDTLYVGDSAYNNPTIIQSGSNFVGINTAGSERARIDSSGNLLVGTTTADAKFVTAHGLNHVVGRIAQTASSGITSDIFQVTALNHAAGSGYFLARFYTSGPSAQFAVRGDGVVYAQNTTIQSISDARVKENVRDSEEGIQTVLGLRTVRFDFKEGFGNNRKNQLGFIAQEVEAVFPDAVDVAGDCDERGDPYKSVGPGALIPVLVKAIQEQQAMIASQSEIINAQQAALTALTARVTALEN